MLAIFRWYINELSASGQNNGPLRLPVSKAYQYVAADGGVPKQKKQNLGRTIEKALLSYRRRRKWGGGGTAMT